MLVSRLKGGGHHHEHQHGVDVEVGPAEAAEGRDGAPDLVAEVAGDPGDQRQSDHALVDRVDDRQVERAGGVPIEQAGRGWGSRRRGRSGR